MCGLECDKIKQELVFVLVCVFVAATDVPTNVRIGVPPALESAPSFTVPPPSAQMQPLSTSVEV